MKVALACEHGGYRLKEHIAACSGIGVDYNDFGTLSRTGDYRI
jgi:ribose 5-phosphate isomerase RpiB